MDFIRMQNADISVVIPCFNHSNVLRRTLRGLTKQTLKPREVVVVDDGSEDDVASVVREFESALPLHLIRLKHNHGAPFTRNEGARASSGAYLLFLDADAELVPDALESFAAVLDQQSDIDFVYANFLWGTRLFRGQIFDVRALRETNFIHTSSLLRRSAFPGFDEKLKRFQDWDLWLTMSEHGSKGYWIDRTLYQIDTTKHRGAISSWLPSFMYRIPWKKLGWEPQAIQKHREAQTIVRTKHGLLDENPRV